ncbi:Biogenesis of lysosome-related organelles complex 1 subunit 1 [Acropora cervicornis]|uniref:Biogenesis of lysosome-related organelles complex 1 subunit 1 n=1 Tax=Acropora cervicornis TaxID=6130 RepID=A0AAD9V5Z7_ACRCE|nr:Biogenesis of lysosome-related organelles complex 1 subunit 1 [Acropora cervicornis]
MMDALNSGAQGIIPLEQDDLELGDVENWSRVIEADMTAIASALEYAYKGDGPKGS